MGPGDLAKHSKLNGRRLDSHETVRWEVTTYVTLAAPTATAGMYVDEVGYEDGDKHWYQGYDDSEELYAVTKCTWRKGEGTGKGVKSKGKRADEQGKDALLGECCCCCEWCRHKAGACPKKEWQRQRGDKSSGKGKGAGMAGTHDHDTALRFERTIGALAAAGPRDVCGPEKAGLCGRCRPPPRCHGSHTTAPR